MDLSVEMLGKIASQNVEPSFASDVYGIILYDFQGCEITLFSLCQSPFSRSGSKSSVSVEVVVMP